MRVLVLNGPNLNMLGLREPHIYGMQTLADIDALCAADGARHGFSVTCRQSNHEGELIDWIQQARDAHDALLINAGGYTHTSVAIHDALKCLDIPVIEVHLSDPQTREEFRHRSFIAPCAAAIFAGHGAQSYSLALDWLARQAAA
jgi:3-dehydroquinate dehydratase-2